MASDGSNVPSILRGVEQVGRTADSLSTLELSLGGSAIAGTCVCDEVIGAVGGDAVWSGVC